jgi:hypothetical protein
MGTTGLNILVLSALALNYFEMVFLEYYPNDDLQYFRAFTLQYFILGVNDIFLSYMIWFMMDGGNQPLYI